MHMRNDQAVIVRRSEYQPPAFLVDDVALEFDLDPELTQVTSTLAIRRNPDGKATDRLLLDGEDLELISLEVDGHALKDGDYESHDGGLVLPARSDRFVVRIVNRIRPAANTELMGLYLSHRSLFTQCEAEGFRRITYFPDRPDVMARYRVTLRADKARFPVLLANGNLVEQQDLPDGRHLAQLGRPVRQAQLPVRPRRGQLRRA